MKSTSKFKLPENPKQPYANRPGLALEIADSPQFVDDVLGKPDAEPGRQNRKIAETVQKLDFYFIAFYVVFFGSAALQRDGWSWWALLVIVSAVLTGIFDIFENLAILRILSDGSASPPKTFGQMKWIFYFLTLGLLGLSFFLRQSSARTTGGNVLGTFLIIVAVCGISSAVMASFNGITIALNLSFPGLIGLALAPILAFFFVT